MKISTRFQPIYVPKAWALSTLTDSELRNHAQASMRYLGLAQLKVEGGEIDFDPTVIPDWMCEINDLPRHRGEAGELLEGGATLSSIERWSGAPIARSWDWEGDDDA